MDEPIEGEGQFWSETGTEGGFWTIYKNGCEGYEGMTLLKDGDHLTVYAKDTRDVLWAGTIKLEYKRRYRPYPRNPQYGQQEVFGYWVHGLQEDVDPEVWAKWFFDGLPMTLVVKYG